MTMFQHRLENSGIDRNRIIAINLEDLAFADLKDPSKLNNYILSKTEPSKKTYLFIDEVQNVDNFQLVVDSLFLKKNLDIYLTGSNAYILSGELATHLSGRYITIDMLPLSFSEYVLWTGDTTDLFSKYRNYLQTSSFPYVTNIQEDQGAVERYLSGIYNTVVLKDVSGRLANPAPMMLESIIKFIFSNIGSSLSTNKIANTMTSQGRKINVRTVEKYVEALKDSYIIYQADRYDIKGKQHLKTLEKYYVVDIGLRFALLGRREYDAGHILENIVYLELIRRGYRVYVGKVDANEVDFVAANSDGTHYYQVAATVRDENTLKRELLSLQKIKDSYPKTLLTLDDDPDADYDGIYRKNAIEWLMNY